MIVQPPCEHLPLLINVERVMVPTGYVQRILSMNLLNPKRLLILIPRVKHPPYLTALWIAPCVDLALVCQD